MNATTKKRAAGHGANKTHTAHASRSKPRSKARSQMQPTSLLPSTNGAGLGQSFAEPQCHGAQPDPDLAPPANDPVKPTSAMPAAQPSGGSGGGHVVRETQVDHSSPDPSEQLRTLQAFRVNMVRSLRRLENSLRSVVAWRMGYTIQLPEPDRKRITDEASNLIRDFADGDSVAMGKAALLNVHGLIEAYAKAIDPIEGQKRWIESEMERLARTLSAYSWVESVKGLAALGLAIIVGESGNLSNYSNPAKLIKRLGLAPPECYRQMTEDGPKNLIPRRRRSAIWTIADSLLRQKNLYQDIYRQRRIIECQKHPEFDKGQNPTTGKPRVTKHCDNRARRYAEQRMIIHLWCVWNGVAIRQSETEKVSA